MSGTYHHRNQKSQHCGHDLWSRRPCSQMPYCSETKKLTRQIERAKQPKIISNELDDYINAEYWEQLSEHDIIYPDND